MNIILILAMFALGTGGGYTVRHLFWLKQQKKFREEQKKALSRLEKEEAQLLKRAQEESERFKSEIKSELREKEKELKLLEVSLREREKSLDRRAENLDEELKALKAKEEKIEEIKEQLRQIRTKQEESLERIAKLSKEEAKKILLDLVEKESKEDLAKRLLHLKKRYDEEFEIEAKKTLSTIIERIASEQTVEMTTTAINIPSEEMKGRVIGKEGRNIQAFERATGVDVIIDETPDVITLSSFDPLRRHVAAIAMQKLIKDGRIHPARIEEVVKKTQEEVQIEIRKAGEEAAIRTKVSGLPPEIIKILGSLKFRTSYGQNQLNHSIEVANIAGMLAEELNADVKIAKTAGLLHDIGKAVDHDVPGPHHHLSAEIARKYGFEENVIQAILSHHDDVPTQNIEDFIVKTADSISGARPGSRRESLEQFIQRMKDLENIVNNFKGVEKSYAIQAGREVRVLVKPEEIDDLTAIKLAREIADKIEADMAYPGQIKITVIRETRAIEYAR